MISIDGVLTWVLFASAVTLAALGWALAWLLAGLSLAGVL